jgi:predicted deacylase
LQKPPTAAKLSPLDIKPYRTGNTGIDYATTFDSGRSGPHAVIVALVHGNELCGPVALDFLFRSAVRPTHGRLTLAFANVTAYEKIDAASRLPSRFVEEDFNRLWALDRLDGTQHSVELDRARELRPLVESADFLLDLHSMQNESPPLMLCGPQEKGRRFARKVGIPEIIVADEGHAAGRRLRDYGAFTEPHSPKNALLVECGQHLSTNSGEVAKATTLRFLSALDMLDPAALERHNLPPVTPQRVIEVTHVITVTGPHFTFAANYEGLEIIPRRGTEIGRDGREPVVTPYDDCILIMPSRRLSRGQTAVRLGRYAD